MAWRPWCSRLPVERKLAHDASRHALLSSPAMVWRLITIRPSHYNEKARWVLDRFRLAYDEQPFMPMLHFPSVAVALLPSGKGRADRTSTRLSTPVLLADGQVLSDSCEIVEWVSRRHGGARGSLYWSPRAAELERHWAERLGADTRRVAYHHILGDDRLMIEMAERNVSHGQARLFARLLPVIRRSIRERLRVDEEHAARSLTRIEDELAAVDDRLADGRPYLLGDRFSAADLAFACMLAPVLGVQPHEGYGAWLPGPEQQPPSFAALSRRIRETPAGAFALRMFAEERGERVVHCEPRLSARA